jgi:hypothetical protein
MLDIFQYLLFGLKNTFWNLALLPLSGKRMKPTLLGPLYQTNLSPDWGSDTVDFTLTANGSSDSF